MGARIMPGWGDSLAHLAVVELDQTAPAGVPRYPLYGARDEVGKPVVLVGYGIMGHGSTGAIESAHMKRAGLNRFEALGEDIDLRHIGTDERLLPGVIIVTDFDSGLDANNTLWLDQGITSDLGFGADEAFGALGDSGGPVFIDGAIAGVMAWASGFATGDATADSFDSSWGELSFDTCVSNFQEFITTATGGQAVLVPEPGALAFAVCGAVGITMFTARSRQARRGASQACVPTATVGTRELAKTVGMERIWIRPSPNLSRPVSGRCPERS
jgi:hypothetical protein